MTASSVALSQFVLKVHSRCNLACDHCYMYEHVDQSWRHQPRSMEAATLRTAAGRIAEHAATRGLDRVTVVLHGGEPLLVGLAGLRDMLIELRRTIDPVARLDLRMQSNGLQLTPDICDLLLEFDVHVGISLDGDRVANDRHRRYADGSSSHDEVVRALALLGEVRYRGIFAGILCTIDLRNDPIEVYESVRKHNPPAMDLLLPHATWDRPPERHGMGADAYGTWLTRIYRRWVEDDRPISIRLFDSLLATGKGGKSASEWVGLTAVDLAVVETNGEWQQVDSLKTTAAGGPDTGLNIFAHSVDELAAHPAIARRQLGLADLSRTCRECAVVHQCGGGLFAHRFRADNGFDNPSVYCDDLKSLIAVINDGRATAASELEAFADIAAGYGAAATVERLADVGYAITRALIVAADRDGGNGFSLLAEVERSAPQAVRSVLSHPYVRVWANDQIRNPPTHSDDGYLSRLAVAAALGAGLDVTVAMPVPGSRLALPTVGVVELPHAANGPVPVSVQGRQLVVQPDGQRLVIDVDGPATRSWQPVRRLDLDGLTVTIEDGDPYRDCFGRPAADRLSTEDLRDWHASLREAWRLIRAEIPGQVPTVVGLLRAVTPLTTDPTGERHSATARHAVGALGIAAASPDDLAVMLVHELQHTKLGLVLDICDLYDRQYTGRVRVGWRSDPRPVEGVLQGIYAHLGVADIWRARAARTGSGSAAAAQYRQYRDWSLAAIEALTATEALTEPGRWFVDRMSDTITAWET